MSAGSELTPFLNERIDEVREFLELLKAIEQAASTGVPRLERSGATITVSQQRILSSSVYLQLYNLVEAIVTRCLDALTRAFETASWQPADLDLKLRQEWVRFMARTHVEMTPQNRLKSAMQMCEHLIDSLPLGGFRVDPGGGGNWDDDAIYKLTDRVGCKLQLRRTTAAAIKRPMRDGLGALKLVKNRRNGLAHGSISFIDCADGVLVAELIAVADAVETYLREVVDSFVEFIDAHGFLLADRRPPGQVEA